MSKSRTFEAIRGVGFAIALMSSLAFSAFTVVTGVAASGFTPIIAAYILMALVQSSIQFTQITFITCGSLGATMRRWSRLIARKKKNP